MDQHTSASEPPVAPAKVTSGGVGWQNLREWMALLERNNELQHITKPVDADEELGAVTYMATRSERSLALLFENMKGDTSGARILANMLGSSKERYALAVGLDLDLSVSEMIHETRAIMNRRIPPMRVPKSKAPVNEIVVRGNEIDLTTLAAVRNSPAIWNRPGSSGAAAAARPTSPRSILKRRRRPSDRKK